ncbi:MAG: hypothetical protein J5935_00680 [Lachnospiraceae bacterium]|nr:hypothetical protein [Lachnospiraceae bacterium]
MNSRIEDIIAQIQEYIDGCKYQAFSSSKIIVDREELYGLLDDLHASVPVEIERHRQIIANKEEILNDARKKANQLIEEATVQTNELINEHAIMQQAYTQANEVMALSSRKADAVLRQANEEATAYRESAVAYVEGLLDELETLSTNTLAQANDAHSVLSASLENYIRTLRQNKQALVRESLVPEESEGTDGEYTEDAGEGTSEELKLI